MKTKYKKFTKEYIKHLALLPQNRNMRTYQKWIREQRKDTKENKQICHVVFHFKAKKTYKRRKANLPCSISF